MAYNIIKLFEKGLNVGEVEGEVSKKYGKLNINPLIHSIIKYGFVEEIDGNPLAEKSRKINKKFFSFIKPKSVSWLFNKSAYLVYLFIITLGLLSLILQPSLFPSYSDFFFTKSNSLLASHYPDYFFQSVNPIIRVFFCASAVLIFFV